MNFFKRKENNKKTESEKSKAPEVIETIEYKSITGFYSEQGRRDNQEDSYLITEKYNNQQLIIVADGLGGQEYGEYASNQVVEIFKNFFVQSKEFDSPASFLRRTALVAGSMLMQKSLENPKYSGAATTLTGFYIDKDQFYSVNVGDSRVYLYTDGVLIRVTKDHSYVQHMIDQGQLTVDEAFHHPKKNLVTSIIGSNLSELKVDVKGPLTLKKGDILLACSDGIHDYLTDLQIFETIKDNEDNPNLAEILVKKAYAELSQDNITVCFYKFL